MGTDKRVVLSSLSGILFVYCFGLQNLICLFFRTIQIYNSIWDPAISSQCPLEHIAQLKPQLKQSNLQKYAQFELWLPSSNLSKSWNVEKCLTFYFRSPPSILRNDLHFSAFASPCPVLSYVLSFAKREVQSWPERCLGSVQPIRWGASQCQTTEDLFSGTPNFYKTSSKK